MKRHYLWALLATLTPGTNGRGQETSQKLLNGVGQCNRPNVVFILTDDQDAHLNSLDYMPHVRRHLLDQGTYFQKHYCTTAVCCPSRVTLWTGKAAHNTNITDVNPPYGKSGAKPLQWTTGLTFLPRRRIYQVRGRGLQRELPTSVAAAGRV